MTHALPNPEFRERERLRREAAHGPCPVCGRLGQEQAEASLRSYAASVSTLAAKLTEAERQLARLRDSQPS